YLTFLDKKAIEVFRISHPTASLITYDVMKPDKIRFIYTDFAQNKYRLELQLEPNWSYSKINRIKSFDDGWAKPFLAVHALKELALSTLILAQEHQQLLQHDTQTLLSYYLSQEWQKYSDLNNCSIFN